MSCDRSAEAHDGSHKDFQSPREGEAIADVLRSFVRGSRKVLDLGCGAGLLLDLLDVHPEARWFLLLVAKGSQICCKPLFSYITSFFQAIKV